MCLVTDSILRMALAHHLTAAPKDHCTNKYTNSSTMITTDLSRISYILGSGIFLIFNLIQNQRVDKWNKRKYVSRGKVLTKRLIIEVTEERGGRKHYEHCG
ncbi:hypothetical protein VNO77_24233 [Canavalia gladiata]|uniref:Uncharacterized protein n=1 Tax=Canavalia gladiata TaxID=3824 RepID=A0AAN9QG15_CANGL